MLQLLAAIGALALSATASPTLQAGTTVGFNATTQLVTLYANDPLSSALDLGSALSASVFQGFTEYNSNSDIVWNSYFANQLSSGVQGDEQAAWADVGPMSRPTCNTVGDGQTFASIHIAQNVPKWIATCGQGNACPQVFQEIPGAMAQLGNLSSLASIVPTVGNIYLLRIVSGGTTRAAFKILVVDLTSTSVTIRYGILNWNEANEVTCCNAQNENVCAPSPRNLLINLGPAGVRGSWLNPVSPGGDDDDSGVGVGTAVGISVGVALAASVATAMFLWCRFLRRTPDSAAAYRSV
jgi:hypothetical protein